MIEYRDDDIPDKGWCPWCAKQVTTVYVDGSGWCPEHGKVYLDWSGPAVETNEEEKEEET